MYTKIKIMKCILLFTILSINQFYLQAQTINFVSNSKTERLTVYGLDQYLSPIQISTLTKNNPQFKLATNALVLIKIADKNQKLILLDKHSYIFIKKVGSDFHYFEKTKPLLNDCEIMDTIMKYTSFNLVSGNDFPPIISDRYSEKDKIFFSKYGSHLRLPPNTNEERDQIIYNNLKIRQEILSKALIEKQISYPFYNYFTKYFKYLYLKNSIYGFEYSKEPFLSNRLKKNLEEKDIFSDENLEVESYKLFLKSYVRYQILFKSNVSDTLYTQLLIADSLYDGKSKQFCMFSILNSSFKGEIVNSQKAIEYYFSKSTDTTFRNIILEELNLRNNISRNKFLGNIINVHNNTISFDSLVHASKDSIIYIDFWASWCKPCVEEMPQSKIIMSKYKMDPVKLVYISLDDSKMSWNNSQKNWTEIMKSNNSYLLLNGFKSILAKKYNITTIPRYILINKDGTIINADAPRPSDPKLKTLIDKYLTK